MWQTLSEAEEPSHSQSGFMQTRFKNTGGVVQHNLAEWQLALNNQGKKQQPTKTKRKLNQRKGTAK